MSFLISQASPAADFKDSFNTDVAMAGDWIKMRGALTEHPKVIAVARLLNANPDFREWLTPGGGSSINGQIVSDDALRCVTTSLLMRLWSRAREHGKFVDDDLILPHNTLPDLDQMTGAPGVGEAIAAVGWADGKNGVTLYNFKEYNVPLTPAEKQKAYRERHVKTVTKALPKRDTGVTSREEKRREDISVGVPTESARTQKPTLEEVSAYVKELGYTMDPEKFWHHFEARGWRTREGPLKSWKSAVVNWQKNEKAYGASNGRTTTPRVGAGQRYSGDE